MPPSAWRKVEQGSGAVARLISSTGRMARGSRIARGVRRTKQSCGDGGMGKGELGHEGVKIFLTSEAASPSSGAVFLTSEVASLAGETSFLTSGALTQTWETIPLTSGTTVLTSEATALSCGATVLA